MKHKIPKRMHYGGDGTESYRKSFTYRSLQHYIVQLETAAATTQRQFRVEGTFGQSQPHRVLLTSNFHVPSAGAE